MKEVVAGDGDVTADVMLWRRVGIVRRSEMIVVIVFLRFLALDLNAVAVSGWVGENSDDIGKSVDLSHGEVGRRSTSTRWRKYLRNHLRGGIEVRAIISNGVDQSTTTRKQP